jgi:hypothetical protein
MHIAHAVKETLNKSNPFGLSLSKPWIPWAMPFDRASGRTELFRVSLSTSLLHALDEQNVPLILCQPGKDALVLTVGRSEYRRGRDLPS